VQGTTFLLIITVGRILIPVLVLLSSFAPWVYLLVHVRVYALDPQKVRLRFRVCGLGSIRFLVHVRVYALDSQKVRLMSARGHARVTTRHTHSQN
jgi:hypothetical protein